MIKWTSCSESLPPRGKWVEVSNYEHKTFVAKRTYISNQWRYKSGIIGYYISGNDKWREINIIHENLQKEFQKLGLSRSIND